MRRNIRALAMCQSLFCAIPCPWQVWDEEARPRMLAFLPVIGLEIGLIWALLALLADALALPRLLTALLLAACPFVLTGHIHLDGFMDVTDAVRSCRELSRRREILKDPHVGSFAVIGCILVLLAQFACFGSGAGEPWILLLIPAVSRCCSAIAVTVLPSMTSSQYAEQKKDTAVLWAAGIMLPVFLAAGFLWRGRYGWCLAAVPAGYAAALLRGCRGLGGMSGDIAGYALTVGELCAAVLWALL
ncbi:MAG: adenosylcobinamide-GDP ribazoletransferase [Oscillospiraceae bacterium]|nr:adenosylcobinamide-GDP ribazoletransferase [Oscillospiraceae bacterium]